MTKPQLATGPQKWLVLGPTGLFRNDLIAVAMAEPDPRGSWNHLPMPRIHTYRITAPNSRIPDRNRGRRSRQDGEVFREKVYQPGEGREGGIPGAAFADGGCGRGRRVDERGRGIGWRLESGGKHGFWWRRRVVGEWGALGILDVWGPDAIFPVRPTVEDSSYFNFIKKFELNFRGLLNFSSKQARIEVRCFLETGRCKL